MISVAIPVSTFLLGLLGSIHCAAMCGGISGYLQQGTSRSSSFALSCALALGRLISYSIAGAIAATVGMSLVHLLGHQLSQEVMQVFVGLFLILLGVGLSGWWNGLVWVEKTGALFWRSLAPIAGRVLPATTFSRAFTAGALWGWLPCGLVYSALVLVMGSGSMAIGAVSMFTFGLGTAPVLMFIGITSHRASLYKNPIFRRIAGTTVTVFGALIFSGFLMSGAHHH